MLGEVRKVTWTASADSNEINVDGIENVALYVPAGANTTITVLRYVELTGTFVLVAGISHTITAAQVNVLNSAAFLGAKRIKLRAGASQTVTGELQLLAR